MTVTIDTPHGTFTYKSKAKIYGLSLYRAKRVFGFKGGRRAVGDVYPSWHRKPFHLRESPIHPTTYVADHVATYDLSGNEMQITYTIEVKRVAVPPTPKSFRHAGEGI